MYYYHISDVDNLRDITTRGLRCNKFSRKIYLFRSGILNDLANRLGFLDFVLFRIDSKGIDGIVEPDAAMRRQYYVKQKRILPQYVTFVGIYSKNKEGIRYHKVKNH